MIKHLAIIMDGNRRWATERGLPKMMGHSEGAKNLRRIAKAASDRGMTHVTLWALSTENIKNRSKEELAHLFSLIEKIPDYLEDFAKNNGRLNTIGDLSILPESTRRALEKTKEKTAAHTGMVLNLAVNYGGRDEILRAIQKATASGVPIYTLDETSFAEYLDTAGMPDPDLIIRTGGHHRLSGYLPWQSTYSELYFTPIHWPAFDEAELDKAIAWFETQQRNLGA